LSGGQRQRLAIARAMIRNPRILLLDEVTTALDPSTETSVNAMLARIGRRRTVLSVTHRLAAAHDADQILVFDHGRLVERGAHDELVAANGAYRTLWEKQSGFEVS
jgi:ATP-binding cassette subfamily B protein